MSNLYANFSFTSTTSGYVSILFKYFDYQNYIALEMYRSESLGHIKLIKNMNGKIIQIKSINCNDSKSILGINDCGGYVLDKKNLITIITYLNNITILFNKVEIIKYVENDLDLESRSQPKFAFSISAQNNFIVDKIEIKEFGIQEFLQYQSILSDKNTIANNQNNNNNNKNFQNNETNSLVKKSISGSNDIENNTKKTIQVNASNKNVKNQYNTNNIKNNLVKSKNKLRYNKETNKFEEEMNLDPSLDSSSSLEINTLKENKLTQNSLIINNSKQEISNETTKQPTYQKNEAEEMQKIISKIETYCKEKGNPDYVCSYLTKVLQKYKIGEDKFTNINTFKLQNVIMESCLSQMKNDFICNQILNKLKPVIIIILYLATQQD